MEYICLCGKNFGNHKSAFREHNKVCVDKPTNYECKFCGKTFNRKGVCVFHENNCNENPNKLYTANRTGRRGFLGKELPSKEGGWDCVCGENFRTRRLLQEHKKACKEKNQLGVCIKYVDYTCQFCKKDFLHKPINSKTLHEKQCYQNPNRVPNKQTGHRMSDEQKQKISSTMKKKIADGSFIVPYKRNHSSKVSYPEQYFMEVFKELNLEYNYQVGLYQLDFADLTRKIYVEIDGEQHYVDKKIVQHDIERTEKLTELGWKCLQRVRWSDFQKLNDEQKVEFCKNLINNINNY